MDLNNITYKIRGCIYEVYKTLGPGLLESVYEEALATEFIRNRINFDRQIDIPIIYKGKSLNKYLTLDLLVEDSVIVELKSVEELKPVHYKQLFTYLKLADCHVGLLVNFNVNDILAKNSINRIVYNF